MNEVERRGGRGFDLRRVVDALPHAVVVTDPLGAIVLWSDAAEHLYGWAESEVLGRSVIDVLAPVSDLPVNRADLQVVATGATMSGDRTVVRRSGEPLRVLTFTRSITDDDGNVVAIVGVSEDITDVRLAEQRTRELTEHFNLALRAGGLGTWRWDITTGSTVWDERLEALFGFGPGEFDGTFDRYVSLLHPDDRVRVLDAVDQAVSTRSGYRVEHRVVWPDGTVRWLDGAGGVMLDEQGVVTGTAGCVMDVTDRVGQDAERRRLVMVAEQAAQTERLQRERLEFLARINDSLNASSSVREIMVNVTTAAVPGLGDWCSIHVLPRPGAPIPDVEIAHVDPDMVAFAHELQQRFPYDPNSPVGVPHVLRTGQTLFYPDIDDRVIAESNPTDEQREIIARLALRSTIVVPFVKRGRVLGAIQFVMSSSSRRYTDDDVALAQTVAGRIASSLENRRLNAQQQNIAHTLQRSLLPDSLPTIPGVELAVRYRAAGDATEVGGDFYDVFVLEPDKRWGLVIGDVCGTGPTAAALTGLARHTIRDSAWHDDTPVEVLSALNRAVRRSGTESFLTAIYATLERDGADTLLTLGCGGHPLPIRVARGAATTIGTPGTLLGVFDNGHHTCDTVQLAAGDVVVLYTDGATDVAPPHGLTDIEFATLAAHAAAGGRTADGVAGRIEQALDTILAFDHRNDDIALLVMRVTPSADI